MILQRWIKFSVSESVLLRCSKNHREPRTIYECELLKCNPVVEGGVALVIGDHSKFAIEFELDQNSGNEWLFGKFCYWINDTRIGDYELGTSLRDVLFALDDIVKDNGHRAHTKLFELSASDLFIRLESSLYGFKQSEYDELALQECWARFNLALPVDIFDGYKVYLVENVDEARIIFRNHQSEEIQEKVIPRGMFDEVVSIAQQKLSERYMSYQG